MQKTVLQAHITKRQRKELEAQAKALGVSTAEILRRVLDEKFPVHSKAAASATK